MNAVAIPGFGFGYIHREGALLGYERESCQ